MQVLGIDIGGSAIKAAPVELTTGALAAERLRLPTPQPATPDAVSAALAEIFRHFAWHGPVGCGFPAAIRQGVVCTAANIDSSWIGINVNRLLTERLGTTVSVLNDADAAGLAEMRFGAGRGQRGTVFVVTVGTGLGTALFRDGVLVPNTELGHLLLNGADAERYASAAVRERFDLSYETWADRFNSYLLRLEELFWPDLFIIGGEISRSHEQFFPHLTIATPIVPASLRNEAGIVGAALAAAGGGDPA